MIIRKAEFDMDLIHPCIGGMTVTPFFFY